jgi:hypothetical protein
MNNLRYHGKDKIKVFGRNIYMEFNCINAVLQEDISIDVADARLFRAGDEPLPDNPMVTVGFYRHDIDGIKYDCGIRKLTKYNSNLKDKIIDWSARAAGGLDEAEFYCMGIKIELNDKGDILKGETTFRRRYGL